MMGAGRSRLGKLMRMRSKANHHVDSRGKATRDGVAIKKEEAANSRELEEQLLRACCDGDLEFVAQCIAEERDRGQNVDWGRLNQTAHDNNHMDIVRCISDSGRVSVDTQLREDVEFLSYYVNLQVDHELVSQLYYSCLLGDLEFVIQCIAESKDRGKNVNWERLMKAAYDRNHMDIVCCIRDNGQVSVYTQLYYSCLLGDVEFVSGCVAEYNDGIPNVDWISHMKTAYDNKQMDIVRCIRDSRYTVSLDIQLYYSCLLGDLEFVSQFIDEVRDRVKIEDWERLIKTAYDNRVKIVDWEGHIKTAYDNKHTDIVCCIRDSGRVSVHTQLYYSCLLGDLEFVSGCVAEYSDGGPNVDWKRHMKTAYDNKHMDIVRCIRDSRYTVSVDIQLYYSCLLGDLEFVSQCIAEDRDRGKIVDWERHMNTAYDNKLMDIVYCIRDSGRVPVHTQLYYSCLLGDLEFLSQCIAEDRDRGQNVNWERLIEAAYEYKHIDIICCLLKNARITLADLADNTTQNRELIAFVIENTEDVNREIRPGLNTLHAACYACVNWKWNVDADIIDSGLLKRADVNQKGYMGRTALHFLCYGQHDNIDAILHGTNLPNELENEKSKKGNLPVSGEISGQSIATAIQNLIGAGADVNATDGNGQSPLHLLCLIKGGFGILIKSKSKVDIAITLLERGANINLQDNEGRTPLAIAAQCGNDTIVSFLIDMNCDINMGTFLGQTPLYLSAVANNDKSAESLCEKGVNVNQADEYNVTPLAAACEQGNHQIVDLLLKHGADLTIADVEERTALHKAALCGSTESFKILMSTSIDLHVQDITGCTPLHVATTEKKLQIIQCLLEAGCSVNVENNLGNIALHNAASFFVEKTTLKISKNITEILLQGSEIDHKNNYGHTPLMLSANALNFTLIKILYENKANLKLVNNMHRGLIHQVVENYPHVYFPLKFQASQAIIKWLIEKGLSINALDVNEQTPLHLAAQQGDLELVTFLVKRGSDVTARDSFNHMPLMTALEHPKVFKYLWKKTLPYITDHDFCKLQRLNYWLDASEEVTKRITDHSPCVIELNSMPQNVRKLKLRYVESLEKWLRTENEELPEFMANWLPSLQHLTYIDHPTINKVMWDFLNDLQNGVKKVDPLVAYTITRCGSVEEKTKAFAQDENDCSCVLQNIRFEMFEVPKVADHRVWTAFVHLICKDKCYNSLKRVLDGKKRLSPGKLCHHFGKAIGKVLANPAFWAKYPQLQRISAKDISAGDRRICTMHVIWSDEICPWLKIDIDLAPVIDLSKWKPLWCSQHPLLSEIECIALPKWKMTPEVNMDLMEIGVHSWGPLFHKMPEEMRQGYRLSKVVRGSAVCPQIPQTPAGEVYVREGEVLDFVDGAVQHEEITKEYVEWSNAGEFMNTYLLKQVIMHEYTAWYDQNMEGLDPPVHTYVYWARRIYEKMEEAFNHRELYSWFIPTYNMLTDEKFVQFQDTAILYARLCRRLLTEEAVDHFRKAYLGVSNAQPSDNTISTRL